MEFYKDGFASFIYWCFWYVGNVTFDLSATGNAGCYKCMDHFEPGWYSLSVNLFVQASWNGSQFFAASLWKSSWTSAVVHREQSRSCYQHIFILGGVPLALAKVASNCCSNNSFLLLSSQRKKYPQRNPEHKRKHLVMMPSKNNLAST